MHTATRRVAAVVRADVAVVAVRRGTDACAAQACIVQAAYLAIVTRDAVRGRGDTADFDRARIRRACVAVVAGELAGREARAGGADVAGGAGVAVAARNGVVRVATAGQRRAGVIGAGVAVVAANRRAGRTDSCRACVVSRARVAIGTGAGDPGVLAARVLVARIRGARIAVVAVECAATRAGATHAHVVQGARACVAAGRGVRQVHAAFAIDARVVGARIGVLTVRRYAEAFPARADVRHAAFLAIVAGSAVGVGVRATGGQVAAVGGARIGVVAPERAARLTGPVGALVARCARVAVVAGPGVGREGARAGHAFGRHARRRQSALGVLRTTRGNVDASRVHTIQADVGDVEAVDAEPVRSHVQNRAIIFRRVGRGAVRIVSNRRVRGRGIRVGRRATRVCRFCAAASGRARSDRQQQREGTLAHSAGKGTHEDNAHLQTRFVIFCKQAADITLSGAVFNIFSHFIVIAHA